MTALLISPHNDDAVLFATFTMLRHRPYVIVPLRSKLQERCGITADQREAEDSAAFQILGVTHEQWPYPDDVVGWAVIEERLTDLSPEATRVFAPAAEPEGHAHHNAVAVIADRVFGPDRVTHYMTYTYHGGKSVGVEVEHERPWVTLKLRALACYRSQIENPAAGCTAHFLRDQREYLEA